MNARRTAGTGEYQAVITGAVAVCGLGFTSSLTPAVGHTTTGVLLTLAVLAAVVVGMRRVARWVRECREDRADLAAGAAWRTQHTPTARGCVGAGERR